MNNKVEEDLCHYTGANGLLGILQTHKLWATDIRYLNDSMEYELGLKRLQDFCEAEAQKISEMGMSHELRGAMAGITAMLPKIISNASSDNRLYVTSFTRKKDNLRQWMSYCPANAGYCIVFNPKYLVSLEEVRKRQAMYQLESVEYGKDRFKDIVSAKAIQKKLNKSVKDEDVASRAYQMLFLATTHCAMIKPEEFSDESEIRLLAYVQCEEDTSQLSFRERAGIIIPYLKYQFDTRAIKSIIIGPNANMRLAKDGIYKLVSKLGIECEIIESQCSLRNF